MGAENVYSTGINFKDADGIQRNFRIGMKAQAYLAQKHGTLMSVFDKLSGKKDGEGKRIVKETEYEFNEDGTQKIGDDGKPIIRVDNNMTFCQIDAMVDIVYAGLIRDSEKKGIIFSRDDSINMIDDMGYEGFMKMISGHIPETLPDNKEDPTAGQETKE